MARRSKKDPTGQGTARAKAKKRTNARLASAERTIKERFRAIPRTRRTVAPVVNADDTVVYDYELTAEELAALQAEIGATLDGELETQSERVPPDWYAKPELEQAHRDGTLGAFVKLNALIAGAVLAGVLVRGMEPQQVTPERVLGSRPYRDALNSVYVSGYAAVKSLSSGTAAQVFQRLNAGIKARKTPTEISADISERFNVARSNAERIVNTEINQAYNNAQLGAVRIATEESGVEFGVTHISALLPTTRDNHAARHGLDYTVEDQEAWWDSGANRINCHCTTEPVRLDENRRAVHSETERRRLDEERAALLELKARKA